MDIFELLLFPDKVLSLSWQPDALLLYLLGLLNYCKLYNSLNVCQTNYLYLGLNMSCCLLVIDMLQNIFTRRIMIIGGEWSWFESSVNKYRVLPVLFTRFVCAADTFDHGWWVMIFCCNIIIWGLKNTLGLYIHIGIFLKDSTPFT